MARKSEARASYCYFHARLKSKNITINHSSIFLTSTTRWDCKFYWATRKKVWIPKFNQTVRWQHVLFMQQH